MDVIIDNIQEQLNNIQEQFDELKKLVDNKSNIIIEPKYEVGILGNKFLYNDKGQTHSVNDLPAVIWVNGTKKWFKEDKRHRDNDLPAVIEADGTKYWYKEDKLHRDNDLPAVIEVDGTKEYYRNGVQYIPDKIKRINDLENELIKLKSELNI